MGNKPTMLATSYIDSENNKKLNETVQHLCIKDGDEASAQYAKSLATAAENRVEKFKEKLKRQYESFTEPKYTMRDVIGDYEKDRIKAIRDEEQFALAWSQQPGAGPYPTARYGNTKIITDLKTPYAKIGYGYFKINPFTGDVAEDPILNPDSILWAEVEDELVQKAELSKNVHILDTLSKIINFSSENGLSKEKMGRLMIDFIKTKNSGNP